MPGSIDCGLSAVGRANLIEDTGYMVHHSPEADNQVVRDVPVALAQGYQAQHLHLSLA